MTSTKDPYQTLGLERHATQAEIRRAYSALAKQHHPDRNPGSATALEKFVEATQAYETLSDPSQRIAADASLKRAHATEPVEFDTWGAPLWEMPQESQRKPASYRYSSLEEEAWSEPPYGAIAAGVALFGIFVLVMSALFFM